MTSPRPEKTFETVEMATPARCATSLIPIRLGGGPLNDSPRTTTLFVAWRQDPLTPRRSQQ
jgi:hypothetical protein